MKLDSDTLTYLYSLRRRGIKVGLHRTEALLSKCGDPHKEIHVIHIAGTNGKGSTAAMIASILRSSGRKVGLYTSPHLIRFNERIRIDGYPISDEKIIQFIERYREDIDALGSTFFETTTALTFYYFAQEEVDIAVVEVGLGGRLDSSNVSNTVVSVLTPIDYDHMEFLGFDLQSIAREKCGILKQNVPVVVSAQPPEVMEVVQESASKMDANIHYTSSVWPVNNIRLSSNSSHFSNGDSDFSVPLLGQHQIANAQTAVTACHVFDKGLDGKSIREGLKEIIWPGRLQKMSEQPLVYYDVAHNPLGLNAVLNTIHELHQNRRLGVICALKKNKQVEDMGKLLRLHCHNAITTTPDHSDFFTPELLADQLTDLGINTSPVSIPEKAFNHCDDICDLWLIFGTHYIADAVYSHFHFPFDNGEI